MDRPDVEEALQAFQRVQRALASTIWTRWNDFDLSVRQVKALHVLEGCGELTVGALGERLGIKLPAASIQADNLVQAGLLERHEDAEDRRRVLLRLTAKGEELMERPREVAALLRGWLEELPPAELAALAAALKHLAELASPAPDSEPAAAARTPR